METIALGKTDVVVPRMGVGAWAWGDRIIWGYGADYGEAEVAEAFQTSLNHGVTLVDTAEVYGRGLSEQMIGKLAKGTKALVATKFFPKPPRSSNSLSAALEASLRRLARNQVDLYQIHWPAPWISTEKLMDRLAASVHQGKTRAVGISNYSASQMRAAQKALSRGGVSLASNQVEYSLLHRKPETNGVLETCRELGVTLIAYSPLAKGALSGKYGAASPPRGARRWMALFRVNAMRKAQPLLGLLQEIAKRHGKTSSQVALRWLIQQGTLPIPGAKTARQAEENAGALTFELTSGECEELERVSRPWRG